MHTLSKAVPEGGLISRFSRPSAVLFLRWFTTLLLGGCAHSLAVCSSLLWSLSGIALLSPHAPRGETRGELAPPPLPSFFSGSAPMHCMGVWPGGPCSPRNRFVSFRCVAFRFVLFRFVSFRFVRFVSFRSVSFRVVLCRFVSFCSFVCLFVLAFVRSGVSARGF